MILGRFPDRLPLASYDEQTGALRTERALSWRCRLGETPLLHGWYERYGLLRMGIYAAGGELRVFVDDARFAVTDDVSAEIATGEDGRRMTITQGGGVLLAVPLPLVGSPGWLERHDTITHPLAYRRDIAEMIVGALAAPQERERTIALWGPGFRYDGPVWPGFRQRRARAA